MFGDGTQTRDFIHVEDVVAMHNKCIIHDAANGETFNVGSGESISIKKLAKIISKLDDYDTSIMFEGVEEGEFSKLILDKRRNDSELKNMALSIKKARYRLGWTPIVSIVDGLLREYNWARDNLDRWKGIEYA